MKTAPGRPSLFFFYLFPPLPGGPRFCFSFLKTVTCKVSVQPKLRIRLFVATCIRFFVRENLGSATSFILFSFAAPWPLLDLCARLFRCALHACLLLPAPLLSAAIIGSKLIQDFSRVPLRPSLKHLFVQLPEMGFPHFPERNAIWVWQGSLPSLFLFFRSRARTMAPFDLFGGIFFPRPFTGSTHGFPLENGLCFPSLRRARCFS